MGVGTPLYRDRPMEWVGSWLLGILEIAGWMFVGFMALIGLFWGLMLALWAGIWLKNRIRGQKPPSEALDDQNRGNWRH